MADGEQAACCRVPVGVKYSGVTSATVAAVVPAVVVAHPDPSAEEALAASVVAAEVLGHGEGSAGPAAGSLDHDG